ncbi:GTPase HflX [Candidatus Gottesmanbacteria bacterium]|nr:GTPase HflX [Candidatus Gottesmanbacteria bacterium]
MQEFTQQKRFMLVGLVPKGENYETTLHDMEELESLVKTYGGEVFAATIQKADYPHRATFIGSGKAQEVADVVAKEKIDIVVINDIVKSGQLYTLEKIFFRSNPKIKVWDRVDLILHIFLLHAHTKEANLQIELAHLRHIGPRAYGMGYILSRQGGGIGTVGIGETNTELMKRRFRDEIRQKLAQLEKLTSERIRQIEKRKSIGFLSAAIVGYTNAGKTMFFNRLTNKTNLVADVLFATLDSSVGKLYIPKKKIDIIVSDTIGFIKNLPPSLIDAFKSTLLESVNADLLLVVVDISDPEFADKIRVVEEILRELCPERKRVLYIFNKIDKAKVLDRTDLMKRYADFNPLFVSAKFGEGIDNLLEAIGEFIT